MPRKEDFGWLQEVFPIIKCGKYKKTRANNM